MWTHVAQVTVNADGSFSGTGADQRRRRHQLDDRLPRDGHGRINTDGTISLTTAGRADGASWSLDHAIADSLTENLGTVVGYPGYNLKVRVTPLAYDAVVPQPALANHGDCVSSAAHAGVKGKDLASDRQGRHQGRPPTAPATACCLSDTPAPQQRPRLPAPGALGRSAPQDPSPPMAFPAGSHWW